MAQKVKNKRLWKFYRAGIFTDVFFAGRHHQVLGFEDDDGESFGRRQVT